MENQYLLNYNIFIKLNLINKINIIDKYFKNCLILFIYIFNIYIIYQININKNYVFSPKNHQNDLIRQVNEYIITSLKDILINNITLKIVNPKITSLVINYNSEKTIKKSIRSIQNQNMLDIEILLIDDHSSDKSLNIMEKLQKEDQRIKIIKNNKNFGALYSRSLGAILSKGLYIMALDSDDLFINKDIFSICYNDAEKNYLDIVEFSGFQVKKYILRLNNKLPKIAFYLRDKENNLIIKQPKLFDFLYKKKKGKIIKLVDGYIWGKCIKKSIYIKALNKLGKNVYQKYINYGEDRIVNFILFKIAHSFKFIEIFGIIYIYNRFSIFNSYKKESIAHDELVNLMSIYNLTKNSSELKIVVYELKKRWKSIILPGLNIENKKSTIYLINLLLKSKYLRLNDKNLLTNFFSEIDSISFSSN